MPIWAALTLGCTMQLGKGSTRSGGIHQRLQIGFSALRSVQTSGQGTGGENTSFPWLPADLCRVPDLLGVFETIRTSVRSPRPRDSATISARPTASCRPHQPLGSLVSGRAQCFGSTGVICGTQGGMNYELREQNSRFSLYNGLKWLRAYTSRPAVPPLRGDRWCPSSRPS